MGARGLRRAGRSAVMVRAPSRLRALALAAPSWFRCRPGSCAPGLPRRLSGEKLPDASRGKRGMCGAKKRREIVSVRRAPRPVPGATGSRCRLAVRIPLAGSQQPARIVSRAGVRVLAPNGNGKERARARESILNLMSTFRLHKVRSKGTDASFLPGSPETSGFEAPQESSPWPPSVL